LFANDKNHCILSVLNSALSSTISCLCEKSSKCDFSTTKSMAYSGYMLEAAMKFYKFSVDLKHDFI